MTLQIIYYFSDYQEMIYCNRVDLGVKHYLLTVSCWDMQKWFQVQRHARIEKL